MSQQQAQLVNCKKCGALFVKSGNRDICDNCYKEEVKETDKIKTYIHGTGKTKVPFDEIVEGTGLDEDEVKHLFEIGRLFGVMDKITIKCSFCGSEFECDQKPSFICQNCLNKFTKKGEINASFKEAQKTDLKVRKTSVHITNESRYGFIQNYEL